MNIKFPKPTIQSVLSHFKNPNVLLPVMLIEAGCIAGRTLEGYKRGGKTEAKERILEETTSAAFWLFGVKYLNKLGDFIGKKFLKLDQMGVDVGRDSLRDPFGELVKTNRNKTAAFKFGKIATSVVLSTAVLGFAIPKVKQAMTKKEMEKKQKAKEMVAKLSQDLTLKAFVSSLSKASNNTTFKGAADALLAVSHLVESNTAARLVATDSGMVAGRVMNSRNATEAREFFFQDVSSIYFYLFACSHGVKLLNKITKTPDIHPDTLAYTRDYLKQRLGGRTLSPEAFKLAALGESAGFSHGGFDKNGVIPLKVAQEAMSESLHQKAELMSQLQPKRGGISILSKMQADDVLKTGWTSDPLFLKEAVSKATYGNSSNAEKFVSRKSLEKTRGSVDAFVSHVVECAKKKGVGEIDDKFVDLVSKKTLNKSALFFGAGTLFAVFGLAILIPRLKDYITKVTTGKEGFPGIEEYS